MPTYTYESVPVDSSQSPRRFEVFQRMSDAPLQFDPLTGDPVRKIVTGRVGLRISGLRRSTVIDKKSPAATACGCGTGRPHRH